MKNRINLLVLLMICVMLFVSCSRNNAQETAAADSSESYHEGNTAHENSESVIENVNISADNDKSEDQNAISEGIAIEPKVMYVAAESGLRGRSEPSTSGRIISVLTYGQRIVIDERSSAAVTIDEITDYWFKTTEGGGMWLFGGYLSERAPFTASSLIGNWDDEETGWYVHIFSANHNYRWSMKETSNAENGRWALNGTTLTLTHTDNGFEDYDTPRIDVVQLSVINDKNIVLIYPNNNRLSLIKR